MPLDLQANKQLNFIVTPETNLLDWQLVQETAWLHQFTKDCKAMCAACRGEHHGAEARVVWMHEYFREGARVMGRFVHPIGDKDWTRCRASEIREANPELNELSQRKPVEDCNG